MAGTGTDVGKTWVTAAVARVLGGGAAARKPAQSYAPDDDPARRDAAVLAAATGEDPERVCPPHRWYEVPMAPPMAAAALGRPAFTVADLVSELAWPDGVEIGFVETAGGVRSPIAGDGDCADLLDALRPDVVVLVADAGLGTLNLVRLSAGALAGHRLLVVLTRYDETDDRHVANAAWLRERDGFDVVTTVEALATALR